MSVFAICVVLGLFLSPQDTISLSEQEVYAQDLSRFSAGQKTIQWKAADLKDFSGNSLSDLLKAESPIFLREYGPGQLDSPSFRGTSAGHTAVFWNGIPINSPSLGQSDLSILPIAALDQVDLRFGSTGALYGNEAIGGSIHLETKPIFSSGFKGSIGQTFGSFGQFETNVKAQFSTKKLYSKTSFYIQNAENDFLYKDLGQMGTPVRRQEQAGFSQRGATQDLAWQINSKSLLKSSLWYNLAEREIQPLMGSDSEDVQEDESFRWSLDYTHFNQNSIFTLKTGFILDDQLFNSSRNKTQTYFVAGEWEKEVIEKWIFLTGVRLTYVEGFLSTFEAIDERIELYQNTRFQATENLAFSLNLRQVLYSAGTAPFTPSLGMDWSFWKKENQSLLFKTSLGKGFKIPTLNDRFWNPGGNPDLIPEESLSGEVGMVWERSGKVNWEQSLTHFRMNVSNWIIWTPQGNIWSPENIREVRNRGFEYQGSLSGAISGWDWTMSTSYTYTQAVTLNTVSETDTSVGKQLPYTPLHQANGKLQFQKNDLRWFFTSIFVGKRSVTANAAREMAAYQIFNTGLSYQGFSFGKAKTYLGFQINNLFNKEYQVLYLRPMPGRAYQLNLTIQL